MPIPSTTRTLLLALISMGASGLVPAAQAEVVFTGRYRGRGEGLLTLRVAPATRDQAGEGYAISADTAVLNVCTGIIDGLARRVGPGRLRLTAKDEGSEETCTLDLTFSADGRQVRMQETGCSDYHGTSCSFDGSLRRR